MKTGSAHRERFEQQSVCFFVPEKRHADWKLIHTERRRKE
jgi:hypothetical protein